MPISMNAWSICTSSLLDLCSTCTHQGQGRAVGLYLQLETALVLRLQASIDQLDSILPLVRPLGVLLVILDVIQL